MTAASLWDWARAAYAAPGVEAACLELQDAHGQNVPLLLWAAWTASMGVPCSQEDLEAACDTARAWDEAAVAPLRAVRRTLKAPLPDIDDQDRLSVRAQVKAVELEAEKRLLAALEAVCPMAAQTGPPQPALDGMVAAARAWSPVTPRPGLIRLAERLPA